MTKYKKYKILVGVLEYAQKWGIHRDTVHQRLVDGEITAYYLKGKENRALLDEDEEPKMEYRKDEENDNQPEENANFESSVKK